MKEPLSEPGNLDLTALINAARDGDRLAGDRALAETYQQLRVLARRIRSGDSDDRGPAELTPTELLHEAWFKLFPGGSTPELASRAHFMNLAARAMRQVLVDLARERGAQKRGGDWLEVTLNTGLSEGEQTPDLIAIDQALQRLERRDPKLVRIVEAYYFAGMSFAETGEVLGISERSVRRGWELARAFLLVELAEPR
ncbi:MAG: sigma-70 family RNA polymerase sigma factor [Ahniella sp.]|nr:sigma-70 family RNA polymerase sigma factor [Ahniella sp.]